MSADDERLLAAGMRVGLYFGCDTPDHMADEIVSLRAEVARLQAENATIDQRYREFLRDWADMDTYVRNVAKTVLPAPVVDGNSYGVPTIEDVADMLVAEVARLRDLIDRSNLEETDGYEAQGPRLVKNGRILVPKDLVAQEARITEALQTAAKHAREVARLREALQSVRELADNDTGDFRADLAHCVGVAEAALANETPTA